MRYSLKVGYSRGVTSSRCARREGCVRGGSARQGSVRRGVPGEVVQEGTPGYISSILEYQLIPVLRY